MIRTKCLPSCSAQSEIDDALKVDYWQRTHSIYVFTPPLITTSKNDGEPAGRRQYY